MWKQHTYGVNLHRSQKLLYEAHFTQNKFLYSIVLWCSLRNIMFTLTPSVECFKFSADATVCAWRIRKKCVVDR